MTKPAWRVACIGFGDMQHSIWSFSPSFYFRVFIDFEPHCSVRPFGFPISFRCLDNRRYLFSFSLFTSSLLFLSHFISFLVWFAILPFAFALLLRSTTAMHCSCYPPRPRLPLPSFCRLPWLRLTPHQACNTQYSIIVIGTRNLAIPCFFNSLYLVVTYRHKYAHTSLGRWGRLRSV